MRPHPWVRRRLERVPPRERQSRFDTWLNRSGAVAAIAVAVIGAASLFYTVIPIWKMNLLDEQLSQKQIELRRTQDQLESTYRKLRPLSIQQYLSPLVPRCIGALLSMPTAGRERWQEILVIDTQECVMQKAEDSTALAQLRPKDRETFLKKLSKIIARVNEDRRSALAQIEQLPQAIERNPSLLPVLPPQSFVKQVTDLVPVDEATMFSLRMNDARNAIASDWAARSLDCLMEFSAQDHFAEELRD